MMILYQAKILPGESIQLSAHFSCSFDLSSGNGEVLHGKSQLQVFVLQVPQDFVEGLSNLYITHMAHM